MGIGIAAFIIIAALGGNSCRQTEIDNCTNRGGKAITSPWYSEDWDVVRCVEP